MSIKDGQIMKYGSNDTKVMGTYSKAALAALAGQDHERHPVDV